MAPLSTYLIAGLMAVVVSGNPIQRRATGTVLQSPFAVDSFWDECDAGRKGYVEYTGDGSQKAGWPSQATWISYSNMWCINMHVMAKSCSTIYKLPDNSDEEIQWIKDAISIVSRETKVDHRFILAAIMQETKGCVRAPSSKSPDGVHNPGLLQDYKGKYTCNEDGKVSTPCSRDTIIGMVREGVAGTDEGHGLAEDINLSKDMKDIEFAQAYYRGARVYNSGAIDPSNDLGKGGATHCYSSDIANRLLGWLGADSSCTLDKDNKEAAH